MKRLIGAIVDGFGLAAGKKLFDDAAAEITEEALDPREAAQRERERAAAAKRAEKEAKQRAKEQAAAKKRSDAEIDAELAALKKRMGKK
jgi:hypothetical protein